MKITTVTSLLVVMTSRPSPYAPNVRPGKLRSMRAQHAVVARFASRRARTSAGRMVMRWAATAVAAAATTCITTGCGDTTTRGDAGDPDVTDVAGDAAGDTGVDPEEEFYPGVCPAEPPPDAGTDPEIEPNLDVPGDPPVETVTDTGTDPRPEVSTDYYPGVCPAEASYDAVSDRPTDIDRDREEIGPGVCPWPGIC